MDRVGKLRGQEATDDGVVVLFADGEVAQLVALEEVLEDLRGEGHERWDGDLDRWETVADPRIVDEVRGEGQTACLAAERSAADAREQGRIDGVAVEVPDDDGPRLLFAVFLDASRSARGAARRASGSPSSAVDAAGGPVRTRCGP